MGAPSIATVNSNSNNNASADVIKTTTTATAADSGNDTASTYISLIQQYLSVFMVDNATFLAERFVAEFPDNEQAIYLQALCYVRGGKYKAARHVLEQQATLNSNMQYLSAQCSFELKQYSRAEEALMTECRRAYKQNRESLTPLPMDEWILQTSPCPVPCGAAGLALMGKICRKSNRSERAISYFKMSLHLDPFLWTSFEALSELGVEDLDPSSIFGVSKSEQNEYTARVAFKTPLQPMATPAAATTSKHPPFPPASASHSQITLRSSQRNLAFDTPNLTPIPVNTSVVMPLESPSAAPNDFPIVVRRAKQVASRQYYPPSPDTPVTTVTRSMRYLRGLGPETSHKEGRSLFVHSENQTSMNNQGPPAALNITSFVEEVKKPKAEAKVQDILELLSLCGSIYHKVCRYHCKEAVHAVQLLPKRQQSSAWALLQQGRAHLEMNEFKSAQRCLEQINSNYPGHLKGLELLSTVYWHLKKEIELAHLAQRVVEWDRLSPYTWCVVGNCFSLQKDHENALTFFRRSVQLDPDFTYTYTLSGYEYMANEDFEKAISCFRQALRSDDRHYNAWYGLGAVYHRQEKYDLADYHFQRAVSIHPRSSILLCNWGIAQYANGKAYQALDTLAEASRLDPKNPQAHFQRATIYSALHRPEEALVEMLKVRDAAPREASVHFALGKIYKRIGQTDKAMRCFLTAMDLDPKDNQVIKSAMDKLDDPDIDEESMAAF